MPQKVTYTVVEVAELLGISRTSAYECVRRGEIPSLTLGRRVVVPRRAFDAMLEMEVPAPDPGADETPPWTPC